MALAIPDRPLREDAIGALEGKRANIDGAALFWTLPSRRCPELLRLLVAFEVLTDYLDCVSERSPDPRNGLQLHRALNEALDPKLPISDYYRHNPCHEDGGYVLALVEHCRAALLGSLPSYEQVRPLATRAAELAQVLALNHDPDPARRDASLTAWAAAHFPPGGELSWFELAGGASAWLTVLALLAHAADPGDSTRTAEAIFDAYLPWVSLAGTMLDSFSDAHEDKQAGAHSYIAHYPPGCANVRVGEIVSRAMLEASRLPHGERHVALASCMAAMYLSKDSTRAPASIDATRELARHTGMLTRLLIPVLRGWRIAYGLTSDGGAPPTPAVSPRRRLPPSAPLPVVAQTFAFWHSPHAYLAWCRQRYGPTFTVRAVGMAPLVFFSQAQDIKAIVRAPPQALHPGAGASVIAPLVGEGSFMLAEGDVHLEGRRKVLPAFAHGEMQQHTKMINDTAQREIAGWPRGRPVALHPFLRALSLKIILQTIFGSGERINELHRLLLGMLTVTASLALQEQQLRALPPWRSTWRRFLQQRTLVNRQLDRLIADEAHAGVRNSGLLAMMLSPHTEQDDRVQIREDLMSVILAGHETTASELAWALQLLAHHPTIATRLTESIAAGEHSYLKATVYEVLRHRPVFLFTIPRVVACPHDLSGRTYLPPEQLVGCIHLMHHDPDVYENPGRFQPERFLSSEPPAAIWMPWGGGRKRCPGHHLATLEMQIVLRAVICAVQVLPVEDRIESARWRSVIVTPGRGCRVVLRPRRTPIVTPNSGSAPFFLTRGG